jgi:hypothetical protein
MYINCRKLYNLSSQQWTNKFYIKTGKLAFAYRLIQIYEPVIFCKLEKKTQTSYLNLTRCCCNQKERQQRECSPNANCTAFTILPLQYIYESYHLPTAFQNDLKLSCTGQMTDRPYLLLTYIYANPSHA